MDEIISDLPEISQKEIILLKTLNSFLPRFSSFLNPAFLGFPDKNVKVLQTNS
jgi:hypothetical protein